MSLTSPWWQETDEDRQRRLKEFGKWLGSADAEKEDDFANLDGDDDDDDDDDDGPLE